MVKPTSLQNNVINNVIKTQYPTRVPIIRIDSKGEKFEAKVQCKKKPVTSKFCEFCDEQFLQSNWSKEYNIHMEKIHAGIVAENKSSNKSSQLMEATDGSINFVDEHEELMEAPNSSGSFPVMEADFLPVDIPETPTEIVCEPTTVMTPDDKIIHVAEDIEMDDDMIQEDPLAGDDEQE